MRKQPTAALQAQLKRAAAGDAEARRRLLELARDRLTRHARRLLHGPYARLGPCAQTDDQLAEGLVQWEEARAASRPRPWASCRPSCAGAPAQACGCCVASPGWRTAWPPPMPKYMTSAPPEG